MSCHGSWFNRSWSRSNLKRRSCWLWFHRNLSYNSIVIQRRRMFLDSLRKRVGNNSCTGAATVHFLGRSHVIQTIDGRDVAILICLLNLRVFLLSTRTVLQLWNDILSVLCLYLLKLKPILTSVQIFLLQNLLTPH